MPPSRSTFFDRDTPPRKKLGVLHRGPASSGKRNGVYMEEGNVERLEILQRRFGGLEKRKKRANSDCE